MDFTDYTERCFRGEPASCSIGCPFGLDVRAFLEKAARGKWSSAYKQLRNATVFPVIVAALCEAPCRERCQRTTLGDEAIAVRDIETAVLRHAKEQRPERYVIPPKEQSVAVVGAGPAGLACALLLTQARYRVTMFDRGEGWGGCLRGDPRFPEFDADIARQFSVVEVALRFGTGVDRLDELDDFAAVFIATGADGEAFGLLDGWDCAVYATREPRVFLGGMLTGASPVQAIAEGSRAARVIQGYLQTGRVVRAPGDYLEESCARYLTHKGVVPLPLVTASGPDGYTAEEARAEAARCLQCDCDACIAGCEMLRRFGKEPKRLAMEAHADRAGSAFGSRTLTRETYSCNLCGHCKSVCPENVDVGGLLRASRAARVSAGVEPAALHDFWLREMAFATTEGAFASAPAGAATCEYAFYPGCQLGAANQEHVLRAYGVLAARYDLGIVLDCCGSPAYWAGDDARMRSHLAETRQIWEGLGRPIMVFACATCSMMFSAFLPEISRVSIYELLVQAGGASTPSGTEPRAGTVDVAGHALSADVPGRPTTAGAPPAPFAALPVAAPPFSRMAVFDPCNARDENDMEAAVRALARAAGVAITELPEKNRCCGHGGHIRLANPALYEEIVGHRMEADEQPYLVYCANCRDVFAWRGKGCAHVLDIALGLPLEPAVATLDQKRTNSLRVKRELMKRLQGVDFDPVRPAWDDLTLVVPPDARRHMEERLISSAELKEAIWLAEHDGDFFYDAEDGRRVAMVTKPVITYWVHYRETAPNTYEVLAAYSHRMRVG